MICPNCEKENRSDAAFCDSCGASLRDSDEQRREDPASELIPESGLPTSDTFDFPANEGPTEELVTDDAFVGRAEEMAELLAALEDARSGKGRLVMVVGEPGVGKTRTSQELALRARERDTQVLLGRCYENPGAPPYWPWVQAIRSYLRELDTATLRRVMGSGAADIAEIVPEVREALPDLPPPLALENPEQARFRLFDSITNFFRNATQETPLALFLDNLHWADKPTLLLLEFLATEIGRSRLLVV
ncbi:MAG: AAA family ATPase, partial [Dehalococcoidia bacterium]